MLTFGTVVALNNLLALKAFYTFLFNYNLHEKPSFFEKLWLPRLSAWVERRAVATMNELLNDQGAKTASVSLNDVSGDFFSILYCVHNPQEVVKLKSGRELFLVLAQMALEFEKIKKPRENVQLGG